MDNTLESTDSSLQTPGQMIKAAKEARRITTSEVVQRLLLSKQIINALEEDNYSKISAQVYAEGYLKAYAQFLQIPVDTILKSFRRLDIYSSSEIKVDTKPQVENRFDLNSVFGVFKNQRIRLILLWAVGVLVLSGIIFFTVKLFVGKNTEVVTTPSVSVDSSEVTTVTTNLDGATTEQSPGLTTETTELSLEKKGKGGKKVEVPEVVEQTATDTKGLDSAIATTKDKPKRGTSIKDRI